MWKVNDDRVKRSAQSFSGPASLIPHESAECVCVCVCVTHIEGPESFLCARLLRSAHCGALRPSVRCISAVSWSYSSSHALPSVLWWKYAPSHRLLNARKTTQRFFTRIKKQQQQTDGFLPRQDLDLLNYAVGHQSVMHRRGINGFLMWFIAPVYFFNLISRSWLFYFKNKAAIN